jgi:hypothetical protein
MYFICTIICHWSIQDRRKLKFDAYKNTTLIGVKIFLMYVSNNIFEAQLVEPLDLE